MSRFKKKVFQAEIYEVDRIKKYLNKQAESGLKFIKKKGSIYTFEKVDKCNVNYAVDLFENYNEFENEESDSKRNYIDYYGCAGWKYISNDEMIHIFSKEKCNEDVHTDLVAEFQLIDKLAKKRYFGSAIFFLLISIVLSFVMFDLRVLEFFKSYFMFGAGCLLYAETIISFCKLISYIIVRNKSLQGSINIFVQDIVANRIIYIVNNGLILTFLIIMVIYTIIFRNEGIWCLAVCVEMLIAIPIISNIMKLIRKKANNNVRLSEISIATVGIMCGIIVLNIGLVTAFGVAKVERSIDKSNPKMVQKLIISHMSGTDNLKSGKKIHYDEYETNHKWLYDKSVKELRKRDKADVILTIENKVIVISNGKKLSGSDINEVINQYEICR